MEVSKIVCLLILTAAAAADIRFHRLPAAALAAANIASLVYRLVCRREDILLLLGGAAVGAVFFIVSRLTGEEIGYGDSWGILCLGIYLGLWGLIEVLAGTFFLLAAAGVIVLCRKRMRRKTVLPFYPFLTAGYILWMISEAGM